MFGAMGIGSMLLGGALGAVGGYLQSRKEKRARKRWHRFAGTVVSQAEQRAQEAERYYMEDTPVALGEAFLRQSFENPLGTLGGEYASRIRSAQEARGFSGGGGAAGAVQEATWLSRLAESRRQALLPHLGQALLRAQQYATNIYNRNLVPLTYYGQTPESTSSTLSTFMGATQGLMGGAMIGSALQPAAAPSMNVGNYAGATTLMPASAGAAMGAFGGMGMGTLGGLGSLAGMFGMV